MKKKLLSTLLAMVMITTLAPMALAGDFEPDPGLGAIVWEGGIVTLDGDIIVEDRIFVNGDTVLDLNGYTITYLSQEPILIWGGATLTVTGGGEIHREGQSKGALFLQEVSDWCIPMRSMTKRGISSRKRVWKKFRVSAS